MTRRLFLAVGLDDDTRHALAAHLTEHLDARFPGTVVPAENWHITLRFLGRVTDLQRDKLLAYLDQHCATEPFVVRFGGLGAFPSPEKATVGWLAAEADGLHSLAVDVELAASAAGLAPEDRPFHPHLTLSRIRPGVNISDLVAEFPRFPRSMRVEGFGLYESVLRGRNPARYTEIDRIDL